METAKEEAEMKRLSVLAKLRCAKRPIIPCFLVGLTSWGIKMLFLNL